MGFKENQILGQGRSSRTVSRLRSGEGCLTPLWLISSTFIHAIINANAAEVEAMTTCRCLIIDLPTLSIKSKFYLKHPENSLSTESCQEAEGPCQSFTSISTSLFTPPLALLHSPCLSSW